MAPTQFVELGSSDNKLSEDDLLAALFCSMAVYETDEGGNAKAEGFFRDLPQFGYPSMAFEKVFVSRDHPEGPEQKFLAAFTATSIFIAFRGTQSLRDRACDIKFNRRYPYESKGGYCHRGIFDRADSFLGFRNRGGPLPGLLETRKRLVFCGHSLGGAVAHMVLFRILLENELRLSSVLQSETYRDSMISIAFGAPHICDEVAASSINSVQSYRWRFINFVNQLDPVPHMLHHLRSTCSEVLQFAFEEVDSILQSLGGFAGRCVEGFEEGGLPGGMRIAVQETGKAVGRTVLTGLRKISSKWHIDDSSLQENGSSEDPKKPDFYPIGQYIYIHRDTDADYQGPARWRFKQYYGGGLRIDELFQYQRAKVVRDNLQYHLIDCYRQVLIALSFIDSPAVQRNIDSGFPRHARQSPSPNLLVRTPAPKVTFAKWIIVDESDANQRYIEVKGENLLFLRGAVTVTGCEAFGQESWKVINQTDDYLLIYNPKYYNGPKEVAENAISMVVIKTAFGQISHMPILEDYPHDESTQIEASRMISKIVQSLIVKATPPLSLKPDADVMTVLDDIMHCVPSLKGERVSQKLTRITRTDNEGDLGNLTRETNYMIKSVVDFMRLRRARCLKVNYTSPRFQKLKIWASSFLKRHPGLVMPAIAASILVFPVTIGTALLGVLILEQFQTTIAGYSMLLELAILESSEWAESTNSHADSDLDQTYSKRNPIYDLEMKLYRKVEGSSPKFKEMVKNAHVMSKKEVRPFRSEVFRDATSDSRLKLLKRIKVVYDTITLYKKVVVGTHFIAILGNEDAGKSTFIKNVLNSKRVVQARGAVPQTGFDVHTNAVRPYKLDESLWLVDFPGANGAARYADRDGVVRDQRFADLWKQFTALSSSAILFLDFKFDATKEDREMYQRMKRGLGDETQVAVVYNKVDVKFTPRLRESFSAEQLKRLKEKNQKALGCSGQDDVYFSCVDPDIPSQHLQQLKQMGVLGSEELLKVVRDRTLALNRSGIAQHFAQHFPENA